MITNRRNPAMRAAIWLTTLAYILPLLCLNSKPARAQTGQVLRVIVSDFVNKGKYGGEQLATEATAEIYNEMANTGASRFYVYSNKEVTETAKRLSIRVPSVANQPAYFTRTELLRIAKDVGAESIVEGEVGTPTPTKGRAGSVQLGIRILDVASQEYINGGFAIAKAEPRPGQTADPEELILQSLRDASLNVVREVVQRQQVSATVLQRIGDTIVLNRGLRDGIREGDNLVVVRETTVGGRVKQGLLRVARAYATDAEAEVRNEVGAIRPEDIARVLYTQNWRITNDGFPTTTARTARPLNFSLIGSTLAALGIGVLIAEGARSGQTSVTGVVAEPTTDSQGTPQVRIKWRDNIFGQGNVVQYHIYRKPDFPYAPNVVSGTSSGGGGTGGTGGGTGTLFISAFPIGVTSGQEHTYYDQFGTFNPFFRGVTIIIGTAASALSNNNSSGGTGGGTTNVGCGAFTYPTVITGTAFPYPTSFGFSAGSSYTYQVTAIIQRQQSIGNGSGSTGTGNSGGGTGGGTGGFGGSGGTGGSGGGTTGGGTGTGGSGSGQSTGLQCIETDPVESQLATPLDPVSISSPLATDRVNLRQFSVTYTTVLGADLYQLEVSTDSRFSNPSRIFRQQFIGTAPGNIGTQVYPGSGQGSLDLTTQPALLSDPAFANFVNGTTTTAPTLYVRIGARHDEDSPGPINVFDVNNSDSNRDFRFLYNNLNTYGLTNTYNGAASSGGGGVPPPPGSRAARLLNATSPTRVGGIGNLPLPLPGQSVRGRASVRGGSAIQAILGGGQRRR